jgi:curved DNA-binding protein CbpA
MTAFPPLLIEANFRQKYRRWGSQRINFPHGSRYALNMAPEPSTRRKYSRIRAPKGMLVGWKSAGQTSTSRAENMGLGGLYLHVANPPSEGSSIELILDLPTGQFRARAIVRRVTLGKGMGVQFVQMKPEDRAKLHQYISRQEVSQKALAVAPAAKSPPAGSQLAISLRREEAAQLRFERELSHLIELTGKSTYYQLLGVTSDSWDSQVKKSYCSLARRFHPDNHSGNRELMASLKDMMIVITEAYKTLQNKEKRAAYDKCLAASGAFTMRRGKTRAAESLEEWFERANDRLRAKNFVGSLVWLRKCVEAAPEHAVYHAMLACSLGTLPQYRNEAIEHFQKAIDLDPWKELVYVQLAELFENMKLPSRASAVYSRLLEINPQNTRACERGAALKAEKRDKKPSTLISHLFGRKI